MANPDVPKDAAALQPLDEAALRSVTGGSGSASAFTYLSPDDQSRANELMSLGPNMTQGQMTELQSLMKQDALSGALAQKTDSMTQNIISKI